MIAFQPPSYRASASDLTVAVSPLGLVELADEEFEVHGQRLTRYSTYWAWYLGHHYAYRREVGEPQFSFNYVRALSDYITNFCFGKGVNFRTPPATEAIVPSLLKRVWEQDNNKEKVLWEFAQTGSVAGDTFMKVAYEDPYADSTGRIHPGRVRLIPLNPSHCFPEFHPHDRQRLIRFKLKYRFWSTQPDGTRGVNTYTEIVSETGIEEYVNNELIDARDNPIGVIPVVHVPNRTVSGSPWGLSDIQDVIALNREFNEKALEVSDIINYHCLSEDTEALTPDGWKRHDELVDGDLVMTIDPATEEMSWQPATINRFDYDGMLTQWGNHIDALSTDGHRWIVDRRHGRDRAMLREFAATSEIGHLTQGSRIVLGGGVPTAFPEVAKFTDEEVELAGWLVSEGCLVTLPSGSQHFTMHQSDLANPEHVRTIRRLAAHFQGLGHKFTEQRPRENGVVGWYLGVDLSQSMLEIIPRKQLTPALIRNLTAYQADILFRSLMDADGSAHLWYQNRTENRDAFQMLCSMRGWRTRSFKNNRGDGVVTMYRRDHVLAEHTEAELVPYKGTVWCPTVENGTWLARRNGCTYWTGNSAPVTVVIGAKASQLEKGPRKTWALPKDAKVENLPVIEELNGPLGYLELLKRGMHEMTGVPESALGQAQPISNTSGVALHIQYQPLMNVWAQKKISYSEGLRKINELILLTLAQKEPWVFEYDPGETARPEPGQELRLDTLDPTTYETSVHWPSPLPVDILIKLNEVQAKMALGLESKKGALQELGEEFPDEKKAEIFNELMEDAKEQGALDMLKAAITMAVYYTTGLPPEGVDANAQDEGNISSAGGPGVTSTGGAGAGPVVGPEVAQIATDLVTMAYGTKLAQRRNPSNSSDD